MRGPWLEAPRRVAPDVSMLPGWLELPALGLLPVNAYVLHAREPVLVDAGLSALAEDFVRALRTLIDPASLRWVWLTHADPDHVGALGRVLDLAPRARLVTTFLGLGKLGILPDPVPPERAFLLNPGQALDVGDRRLRALRPPVYDAPETTALYDDRTGTLFSADSFGATLPAVAEDVDGIAPEVLRDGMIRWATVDAPWLHAVVPERLTAALDGVCRLGATTVLSAHLPPARGETERLCANLAEARTAPPFVGPDQEAMLAGAGA